jgi:uncharacterized protein DUF4082/Big-like domain-containing protein/purple acid phosphatase-like protein/type IX secretion system substrate protein
MFTTLSTSARRRSIAFFLALPLFSFIISQSNIVTKNRIGAHVVKSMPPSAQLPVTTPAMAIPPGRGQAFFDCPCTIFKPGDTPVTRRTNDGTPLEVGVKFRSSQNGFITGIRYYKGAGATGTHLGHVWNSNGLQLGEAAFTNETDSGWQVATFNNAIAITPNTTYIASYFSPSGDYAHSGSYFGQTITNGPLSALANGEDGPNGLYKYSTTPVFPDNNFGASNYWVDVVFTPNVGPDTTAPQVSSVSPAHTTTGIALNPVVTASFNEVINIATVNSSSFQLKDVNNNIIPATINISTSQITLTPTITLQNSTLYIATIKGGATGVKDTAGNALLTDFTWSFSVVDLPGTAPTEGAGGPVLVISSADNPFSKYTVEILRAEGLNEFAVKDINSITSAELNNYDVVILGEVPVSATQATIFSDWVNAGGTFIAFKPAAALSTLLGITPAAGSLANQYLLINTASGPGKGIVNETIQFHGAADLYTLNGATAIATLYSSATTATTFPAVTSRSVGSNGGQAIAFTFDLPRSIVYTRQGNPDWEGMPRDGQSGPIRSDNLFFGGSEPDWVNLSKVAIPQADEQQRLLSNIILQGNLHRKPLPRFWYLPGDHKAAIVMTGDDHANNGTTGRFEHYRTLGPNSAEDVANWKAVRGTSYIRVSTNIPDAQAAILNAQGFEIAVHLYTGLGPDGCENYTPAIYENNITDQFGAFARTWPSLPAPVTNRTHCIAFNDWATQPKLEAQHGVRLDANYYYWPATWVNDHSGMFTGSGMAMRFADKDGTLIDCYQLATQMTDESNIKYTSFTNQLLDRAVGPEGYYGVFCANMHTDSVPHTGSSQIIASALAHQVPVISAKQLLTWLDGRNNSFFSGLSWSSNQLNFSISAKSGARNLKAMLPFHTGTNQVITIMRNGNNVPFTVQTIKGMQYAFFEVATGVHNYVATYNPDHSAPLISNISAVPNSDGTALITWTTNEQSDSRVDYGLNAGSLNGIASDSTPVTDHKVTLNGLTAGSTYFYRVTSKDFAGNSTTAPDQPLSFIMPVPPCFIDQTTTDFTKGTTDNTIISPEGNGAVALKPSVSEEFNGTTIPAGFAEGVFNAGSTTVNNGLITVDGTHIFSNNSFASGTTLEFVAIFRQGSYQNIGFSVDQPFNNNPWITIGQGQADGVLYARASNGVSINLGAGLLGSLHRYRIKWNTNNFEFYVDNSATPAATISLAVSSNLFIQVSDVFNNDGTLSVDWLRATPYVPTGTFISRVADAGAITNWGVVKYNSETPIGASLALSVRTGNTINPDDGTWSAFTAIDSGIAIGGSSRYIQYKVVFNTTNTFLTPVLKDLWIQCAANGGARLITHDDKGKAEQREVNGLKVQVSPNPFEGHFNLFITASHDQPATIRVLDIHGRITEQYQKVAVNSNMSLGHGLPSGVYFVEVLQGSRRKMVKVIKQ